MRTKQVPRKAIASASKAKVSPNKAMAPLPSPNKETLTEADTAKVLQNSHGNVLYSLYETGNFTDCSVICGSFRKSLHKFVLCPQSAFFKGALEGPFQEAETAVIDLSSEQPKIVEYLLKLMYGFDRNKLAMKRDERIAIYTLAYRLDVAPVAAAIGQNLKTSTLFSLTDDELDEDFVNLVKIAYNEVPDKAYGANLLREPLVAAAVDLLLDWDFTKCQATIGPAFAASGVFSLEVMTRLAAEKIMLQ